MVDLDLIQADSTLKLTPHLMEAAEQGSLDLETYVDLLLKDLAGDPDPLRQALALVDEGKVAWARRFIAAQPLSPEEMVEFEAHCRRAVQPTDAPPTTPAVESPVEAGGGPDQEVEPVAGSTKRPSLLHQALEVWSETTAQFSTPLRNLLRLTDQPAQAPSYDGLRQLMKQIQRSQKDWPQKAMRALRQYFYLPVADRQQLEDSFGELLIVYALEGMQQAITYQDFQAAWLIYGDIIGLLKNHPQLRYSDHDVYNFYRAGLEAHAALLAQDPAASLATFEESLATQIADFPQYLSETGKRQISDYGKVLFFYYRIQTFIEKEAFYELIQFYTEHDSAMARLAGGNLELNRFYETARNNYHEAFYRKTESELTDLELPAGLTFQDTLPYTRQLAPYQIAPVLRRIQHRFADQAPAETAPLMAMYALLQVLFDMQEPEALVFASQRISQLINTLKARVDPKEKGTIRLGAGSEKLPVGVLDTLEGFVQQTITAISSVTDFVFVRHHIAQALEDLQEQRRYLRDGDSAAQRLWHMLGDHWISILVARQRAISRQTSLQLSLQSEEILANYESSLVIYVKNSGPGVARNIKVALASADLSIKESTILTIPILKHGDERSLHFIVKPRTLNPSAEVRLLVRYIDPDDRPIINTENRTLVLKDFVRKKFPPHSPYVWGQPLKADTKVFYGREDVFNFLKTRFWGEERNKIIALQGERRMGKTSILYQFKKRRIFGDYRLVFFDFQARYANVDSTQEFLYHFARRIRREAKLSSPLQVERSEFLVGQREYYDIFEAWLDRVEAELAGLDTQVVIIFDEFEKLLGRRFDDHVNVNQRLVEELLQYLRSLMLTRTRFNWIITGSWSLVAKQREYFSALFGMALSYWVSYLNRAEAVVLIQEPVQEYLTYDQAAIERILRLTGGHPYHIQIICDELFNRAQEQNNHRVAVQDVNQVIDHTLQQVTETNFRIIWASLNDPVSRKVLAAVAEAMQEPGRFVHKDHVFNFLRRRHPGQSEDTFHHVLDIEEGELLQRQLVETHSVESERVRVRSELLYRWLRKAKPLTTVLREER